ncbi:glycosyltransferase (plasmid) [Haloferax sp. S1W]|uniref:glycosyltransferase n=1 Tax=Haloferax sp. S1W TaxID=3377110 RepID=UPI0037C6130B
MGTTSPASVLLPTLEWTDACKELCDQVGPDNELLIICDSPDDPVTTHSNNLPPSARVVVAGEPEGCSGKANAIAAGMVEAEHDRIIWTDDDFHHPPDWLEQMKTDYERQGPTTEVPVFVGRDPLAYLLEPSYVTSTALASAGLMAWGGALVSDREDVDEVALLRDLRRTVNDDATLGEHVDFTGADRTRRVEIGGTIRKSLERHTRFMQASLRHGRAGWVLLAVLTSVLGISFLFYPLVGFVSATLGYAVIYATFGIRRWTALLAYPAMILGPLLIVYGLARRTFVWGGRRYRWRSMFDVEIVD